MTGNERRERRGMREKMDQAVNFISFFFVSDFFRVQRSVVCWLVRQVSYFLTRFVPPNCSSSSGELIWEIHR